jgi:hypothetical protein
MDYFAGLDVSVKDTSVCIVDDSGRIIREVKVRSEPNALLIVLKNPVHHLKRIGNTGHYHLCPAPTAWPILVFGPQNKGRVCRSYTSPWRSL